MILLEDLSGSEIKEVSRHVSDSFYNYEYSSEDLGLKKYITNPDDMFIAGEGIGTIGFIPGMKMIFAEKKSLGGFKNMKKFVSASFSDGNSIETRMRRAKRKFNLIREPM